VRCMEDSRCTGVVKPCETNFRYWLLARRVSDEHSLARCTAGTLVQLAISVVNALQPQNAKLLVLICTVPGRKHAKADTFYIMLHHFTYFYIILHHFTTRMMLACSKMILAFMSKQSKAQIDGFKACQASLCA